MPTYLGETPVELETHPVFSKYTPVDWAMLWIEKYGQIDGDHHKAWVLDQVSRILQGTKVTVTEARWSDGQTEYRSTLGEPSQEYQQWVDEMLGTTDASGEREYGYDTGIAP